MRTDYDEVLRDPRFGSCWGWHEDHEHLQEPEYQPAAAQNREEFIEFLEMLNLNDRVLQIGLCRGGTHRLFELFCREVWSIDYDPRWINKYREAFGGNLICGSTEDPATIAQANAHAPYDVLFIDGNHAYPVVKSDWLNYAPMVRKGGMVAFHDSLPRPLHEVHQLLDELAADGLEVHNIGTKLGIAWYIK